MNGGRKQSGFRWTTIVLTAVAVGAFIAGGDATIIFQYYTIGQTVNAGGFFGFNGVEHLANAYGKKNGYDRTFKEPGKAE